MLNSTEFWVAISFIIFILFSYKPMKSYFIGLLLKRKNDIIEDLHYVESLQEQAKKLLASHEDNKKNIQKEIEQINHDTNLQIERLKMQNLDKINSRILSYEEKITKKIESSEAIFVEDIRSQAVLQITNLVKYVLNGHHENIINHDDLLNSSIKKIHLNK
jgi:F-type H+-transporting ATPase subunit b